MERSSPLLFDGDSITDEFVAETPSPVISRKKRKHTASSVCRPKKSKSDDDAKDNTVNVAPIWNNQDELDTNVRPLRSTKSAESSRFDTALSSLRRQRSRKTERTEASDHVLPARASFKILSDTESDSDDFLDFKKASVYSRNKNSDNLETPVFSSSSSNSSNHKEDDQLPTTTFPSSLKSSKSAFACKSSKNAKKSSVVPETPQESNQDRKQYKNSRCVNSVKYGKNAASSDSTDDELNCVKRTVNQRSIRRKRTIASTILDSSSGTSDSEFSLSLSNGGRRKTKKRQPIRKRETNTTGDTFLPLKSDNSSSDVDEAAFSSFLNNLVGKDLSERKSSPPKRKRPETVNGNDSATESDDDIAILDYIISGKKEKVSRVKAKDISFPDISCGSKTRQKSLTSFFGENNSEAKVKGRPAAASSTVTSANSFVSSTATRSTSSSQRSAKGSKSVTLDKTTLDIESPTLQDSSVADAVLVQALVSAESGTSKSVASSIGNVSKSTRSSTRTCRRPGLPRSSSKESAGATQGSGTLPTRRKVKDALVSPSSNAVKAVQQLENDEAFARQLQEEIDRELAASYGDSNSCPQFTPASTVIQQSAIPTAGQSDASAPNDRMMGVIGSMDDYVWQIHVALYKGEDIPQAPPAYRNRDVNELLNFEVLAYLEERRKANANQDIQNIRQEGKRSNPGRAASQRTAKQNTARSRATGAARVSSSSDSLQQLENNSTILSRIGSMTDDEWEFHRAVFHGTTPRRPGRQRNIFTLDTEVLQFLADREAQRIQREAMINQDYSSDSDESIADLLAELEQLQDGMHAYIGGPMNSRRGGRRGRGRGRGRGGWRGNADLGRLIGQHTVGDDYEQLLELAEQLGSVKSTKGLSTGEINLLPTKKFRASSVKDGEAAPECHVCMCECEENDHMRILTCFHSFHAECIDKWIKNNPSCPVCRIDIKLS